MGHSNIAPIFQVPQETWTHFTDDKGGQANKVTQLGRELGDESLEVSDPNAHTVLL